jgi:hypothetical protein
MTYEARISDLSFGSKIDGMYAVRYVFNLLPTASLKRKNVRVQWDSVLTDFTVEHETKKLPRVTIITVMNYTLKRIMWVMTIVSQT